MARHRDGDDPYALALSLNLHRRHLTTEQKRELIAKLVKAKPEASNLQIAKQVKADDKTVAKVRSELEARSEIPNVKIRTDTKGRNQPSTKPKTSAKPASLAKNIIELDRSDYSEVPPATSAKPTSPPDADDIVGEALRLVEKMTVSQRRDFFARLQKEGLVVACGAVPDDLSIPVFMRRPA